MGRIAERQFALLAETVALAGAGVPFWLRGGWALDFLLGRITREHADVDLVAWLSDREAIRAAVVERGFRVERELPDAAIDFEKQGESVQFLLVERSPSGALVTRGFEHWPWPEGALEGPWCEVEGLACRTLSLHALLEEKESYQRHRDRPPRAKDETSIELLRRLLADRG